LQVATAQRGNVTGQIVCNALGQNLAARANGGIDAVELCLDRDFRRLIETQIDALINFSENDNGRGGHADCGGG